MRALVVEPHDVNELIFASYLSHPFLYMTGAAILINEGESTEVSLKSLNSGGSVWMDINTPAGKARGKASILPVLTDSQRKLIIRNYDLG